MCPLVVWIKNLVLELIRAPIKEAAGDVNFQRNFKSMIQTVLGKHTPIEHTMALLFVHAVVG